VKTSFSSASLHIGSLWARQNALLQVAHVAAGAELGEEEDPECLASGIMVLLVKQVHLQKEGGARLC